MNTEIMEALIGIAKEKNIERESLRDIVENIFYTMIEKHFGSTDNFDIIVNIEKGDIEIYQEMVVVNDDEELIDDQYDIPLTEARKQDPDCEVGDEFVKILDPAIFGRRLIIFAKQFLGTKIRDFEKEQIVEEYSDRIGEIIIGDIHQITRRGIFLNQEKLEILLPREEQIPNERLRRGDRVRGVIIEVKGAGRGPEIIISRKDPLFLTRLFELEVPEIYDGIVEIRGVARAAGERAKVAVESSDKRVDPVGACVGMKGVRIQAIVKELNGERIDIVNYHDQIEIFIARALSPAKPLRLVYNEEDNNAVAVIRDDEMAQAIGVKSQNLNLAMELTGVQIELIKESEFIAETQRIDNDPTIEDMLYDAVGANVVMKIRESGYESVEDLRDATIDELQSIPGVGKKVAEKIVETIADFDANYVPETTEETAEAAEKVEKNADKEDKKKESSEEV
ncbi:MAG: transcription termination factor NusA [Calditrichaeota bacterium]|nr:transcription termination factor NusA [Calditrichota bacterium]